MSQDPIHSRQTQLDHDRPFATVYGEAPYRYEQDGRQFDHRGLEVLTDEAGEDAAEHRSNTGNAGISQEARSSAAERMRRTRKRRRAGIIAVVSVEIRQEVVDWLVARNLISLEEMDDRKKLSTAIRRALEISCQT